MNKKLNRTYLLFYFLVVYILFQFIWWEILLVKQTESLLKEKEKLAALSISDLDKLKNEISDLKGKEKLQTYMIVGEGTVFLILISLGILRVYRTFNRETFLARQQKNFLLSISHELKTPLSGIKLNAETIQLRELPVETKNKLLSNIIQESDRLNLLIENILISSRLDNSNSFFIKKEMVDLPKWMDELVNKSFHENERALIQIAKPEKIMVEFDLLLFPSVILNLIENAIKYSAGKIVQIDYKVQNSEVEINISDEGPGIPESEKSMIFERFYRGGNEETRKTKGTGLGLYIASEIIKLHGGKISISNRPEGGSIFRVKLPL